MAAVVVVVVVAAISFPGKSALPSTVATIPESCGYR